MSFTGFVLVYSHTHTHSHTHATNPHIQSRSSNHTQIFSLIEPLLSKHECLKFPFSHWEFLIDRVLSNTVTKVLIMFFNSISDFHKEIEKEIKKGVSKIFLKEMNTFSQQVKLIKSDSSVSLALSQRILHSFHKIMKQHNFNIDNSLIINASWAANQHIRMISEGSCDTEDWSNNAENAAVHHRNRK